MSDVSKISVRAGTVEPIRIDASPNRPLAFGGGAWDAGGDSSPELQSWVPGLGEANEDWRWSRDTVVGRIRDLERNDGWAAAALERQVDNLAGLGWRLVANVDGRALSQLAGRELPAAEIRQMNRAIEAEWRSYAESPLFWGDIRRQSTVDQNFGLGFYHRLRDGETAARPAYVPEAGGVYGTRLEMFDPDRISTPADRIEGAGVRHGIEVDSYGTPTAAFVRTGHPADWRLQSTRWDRVPRFDELGLPVFLHDFKHVRAGQVRGIPDLAPVVKTFKSLGRYSDADLQTALVNAIYSMTIETNETPSQVADRLSVSQSAEMESARLQHYRQFPPRFANGVRALILKSGDKASLNTAGRPAGDYVTRETALLSRIASNLGQSGSNVSMDWSRFNYSSARLTVQQTSKWVMARQLDYKRRITNPFFLVWLAEAVSLGRIVIPSGWPDFWRAREAYARCDWITPKFWPIDELKEANAAEARMRTTSTMQEECANRGLDWEDVVAQRAREIEECRRLGVTHPADTGVRPASAHSDEPEIDEDRVAEIAREQIASAFAEAR